MGPPRLHWLCGREGRREDALSRGLGGPALTPAVPAAACAPQLLVRPCREPHIPADGFAGSDRRDKGQPRGAQRGRGKSARPDQQVSEGLPTLPASGGRGVRSRGRAGRGALKAGSPSPGGALIPRLGRPRVPEAPLPLESPPRLSSSWTLINPLCGGPASLRTPAASAADLSRFSG